MSQVFNPELTDRAGVPDEIASAVELWARQYGRHAKVQYHKLLRCFVVFLTLSPDDPRMKAYQEGKVKHVPFDMLPLNRQLVPGGPLVAIPIEELSGSSIVERLDEANVWSGRGEYPDLTSALMASLAANEQKRLHNRKVMEEAGQEAAWLHRREVFDVPFSSGGLDTSAAPSSGAANQGTEQ